MGREGGLRANAYPIPYAYGYFSNKLNKLLWFFILSHYSIISMKQMMSSHIRASFLSRILCHEYHAIHEGDDDKIPIFNVFSILDCPWEEELAIEHA